MKITRENLNSLDADGVDIFEYVVGLVERGEMLTHAEAIIVSFLSHARPDVKEHLSNFEGVRIAKLTSPYPPVSEEFRAAMEKYRSVKNEYGAESIEARNQFMLAMQFSPEWFDEIALEQAKSMGLLPKAEAFLEDGTPVFTAQQVADRLGVSVQDVLKHVDELKDLQEREGVEGSEAYLVDPSQVHKIQ